MSVLKPFYFAVVSFLLFEICLAWFEACRSKKAPLDSSLSSEWGEWSECYWYGRHCMSSRTRYCLELLEDGISFIGDSWAQLDFRTCNPSECPQERPTEYQIMRHVYSEWSRWSPCSSACRTRRTRTCRVPALCGEDSVLEYDSFCYKGGDHCEKLYLESLREGLPGLNDTTPGKEEGHPLDNIQCGSPETPEVRVPARRRSVKDIWPWQVLLLDKSGVPFCGGALLSDSWVLTAAHCVRPELRVRAGEYDLAEGEGSEQEEGVEEAYVHPEYNAESVEYDLALLRLRNPFALNTHVQPACLPEPEETVPRYLLGVVAGWGKRRNGAFATNILHQSVVLVMPPGACRRYSSGNIGDSVLCAGFGRREDSCSGDSGGPLLHKRNGRWTVYGVATLQDGCGEKEKYGVYANVPFSLDWIKNTTSGVGGTPGYLLN